MVPRQIPILISASLVVIFSIKAQAGEQNPQSTQAVQQQSKTKTIWTPWGKKILTSTQ